MRQCLLSAAAILLLASTSQAGAIASGGASEITHAREEFRIGVDLAQHGAYGDATAHLETALNEYPDDTDILIYLAFAHRMIARERTGTSHVGELRLANTYYRRALEANPTNRAFLEYMGELYLEMENPEAAREKLKRLDAECPEGCAEREMLARSIAAYAPPLATPAPGALSPDPTH